jgi:hypothetical protein
VELAEAQARRAMAQLWAEGWAVGAPATRDGWRKAVRRQARRNGLRVRTGVADVGGVERPWAVTAETYQAMHAALGGFTLDAFGAAAVRAAVNREERDYCPKM